MSPRLKPYWFELLEIGTILKATVLGAATVAVAAAAGAIDFERILVKDNIDEDLFLLGGIFLLGVIWFG